MLWLGVAAATTLAQQTGSGVIPVSPPLTGGGTVGPLTIIGTNVLTLTRQGVGTQIIGLSNVNPGTTSGDLISEPQQASAGFILRSRNGANATVETLAGDRDGNVTVAGVITGNDVRVAAARLIYWLTRTVMQSPVNGQLQYTTNNGTSGLITEQFTDNPTCGTNCGTAPTLDGVDSSFTLTMGATGVPASGFVVTFNGTWPAAPQCIATMAKAGMVVGKMVLTVVTTTTTATFVTNGTAPANTDVYHVRCSSGQ